MKLYLIEKVKRMSAHDSTEIILRQLHVLLSKSEPYTKEPSKVIVDKQQMLDLLNDLNKSIYDIYDEYELTYAGTQVYGTQYIFPKDGVAYIVTVTTTDKNSDSYETGLYSAASIILD